MSLREMEGPLGTVDLPVLEAVLGRGLELEMKPVRELEAELALERKLETVCNLR